MHFDEIFDNRAKNLCTNLRPLIEQLSEATSFDSIRDAGKRIYYEVFDFMPVAKDLTDTRKER